MGIDQALKMFNDQRLSSYLLSQQQAEEARKRHRKGMVKGFSYDLTQPGEYLKHSNLIMDFANDYMKQEGATYIVDEHNKDVLRFLLLYFNGCKEAEKVFPNEDYKLSKNILLIGEPGTGKTLMMQIFADYLKQTKNEMWFRPISVTQLMNCQKVFGHINKYTYCEMPKNAESYDDCRPEHICLNDLGLITEGQKSYGTQLSQVIDEFLFARYEIYQQYQKRYHITSNLTVADFKKRFEGRLIDRFKSFNVIELHGGSRQK
jgi:DNA replication protein DnaC